MSGLNQSLAKITLTLKRTGKTVVGYRQISSNADKHNVDYLAELLLQNSVNYLYKDEELTKLILYKPAEVVTVEVEIVE